MELMLTGDAINGREAVRIGMADPHRLRGGPRRKRGDGRAGGVDPGDLLQINDATVHRAMEFKGVRTTHTGSELQGLASNLESTHDFFADPSGRGRGTRHAAPERHQP